MISNNINEQFLLYNITKNNFCTPVSQIKEIFKPDKITKLPRISSVLLGVVNLRGKILTVFNPSAILWRDMDSTHLVENSLHPTILLVTYNDFEYGFFIEEIPKIIEISEFKDIDSKYLKNKGIQDILPIKKIGLLESGKDSILLDLQTFLKTYIVSDDEIKIPIGETDDLDPDQFASKEKTSTDDEEFDIDQYTLPDDS